MTDSLIESIESRLSPDVVGKVAGSIGETPAKTSGVISSAVPSIMAGLMHRGSSTSGATGLLSSLKDVDHKSIGDMSDPRSTIASGSRLGAGMLGDTGGRITDMLAKQHGIRRESAAGIMGFLSPLVAGMLAKHVATKGLGPAGLSEFLMSQKKSILGHPGLPSGLANTLGIHNISALGGKNAEVSEPHVSIAQGRGVKQPHEEDDVTAVPPQHRGGTPWAPILGALALGAAVIGGFSYFARGRHIQTPVVRAPEIPRLEHPNVQPPPNNVEPPGAGRASLTSGEMEKKDGGQTSATSDEMEKKDGGQTSLTSGEMEKKDAGAEKTDKSDKKDGGQTSLTSGEMEKKDTGSKNEISRQFSDKKTLPNRVALPHVNFETGATTMVSGGDDTVDKLAQAMKDHPQSRIRLEGHTDSAGDASINLPLSRQRAESIKDKLVAKGIDANRIETAGRAERNPVGDNATNEGRLENRRTDAVILSR